MLEELLKKIADSVLEVNNEYHNKHCFNTIDVDKLSYIVKHLREELWLLY